MERIRLDDIVDALTLQFDEYSSFVDVASGEVATVSKDLLREAEELEEDEEPYSLPAWQEKEWETAQQIVFSDRFRKLPSKFDVHEWDIMREFAGSVGSSRIRDELLDALHGAGAFRSFKGAVRREGVEKAWFAFREAALREIAIEWCERQGILWQ